MKIKKIILFADLFLLIVGVGFTCLYQNYKTKLLLEKADQVAFAAVTMNRMNEYYELEHTLRIFPEKIPHSATCYRAAISNYVENLWAQYANEYGCENMDEKCTNIPDDKYNETISTEARFNNLLSSILNISAFSDMWMRFTKLFIPNYYPVEKTNWETIAASCYDHLRSIFHALNQDSPKPKQERAPEIVRQRIDELNSYVASCDKHKAEYWIEPGMAYSQPYIRSVPAVKLGISGIIFQELFRQHLNDDEKKTLQCLHTVELIRSTLIYCPKERDCSETSLPRPEITTAVEELLQQVKELRSKKCDVSSALSLVSHKKPERQ